MPASLCREEREEREEKNYNDNNHVNNYYDIESCSRYDDVLFAENSKKKKDKKIKKRIKAHGHALKEIDESVEVITNAVSTLKKKAKANEKNIVGVECRLAKVEKLVEALTKEWLDSAEDIQSYKKRIKIISNHCEVKNYEYQG